MDYTTLVERLLDGTITTAEQAELDRMRLNSPDIDREVRSLLEVENLLRQKADDEDTRSLAFRESVRSSLKVSLGLSAATATEAHAPSAAVSAVSRAGSSSMRLMLAAIAVVGAGVGYILFHNQGDSGQMPQSALPQAEQAPISSQDASPAIPAPPLQQTDNSATHAASANNAHKEHNIIQAEEDTDHREPATDNTPVPTEVEGTVEAAGKNKHYSALIQQMLERLGEQEQTSRASAAVTARQVALLYDKLGDATSTRRYFDTARRYAQEASVQETEGEILGDYALFEARNGNKTTAESLAAEALRTLRMARSAKLSTWESSLKQLVK